MKILSIILLLIGSAQAQLLVMGKQPAATGGPITHVSAHCSVAASGTSGTNTVAFTCAPNAANDAIVFEFQCGPSTGTPSAVSLAASPSSGWTFTAMSTSLVAPPAASIATFATIAPNTTSTTFTATFTTASNCTSYSEHMSDEFAGNDTTGGTTTFYAHNLNVTGSGGCAGGASTSTSASDVVWGECSDSLATTNWQGAGWTAGETDSNGEGTEWKTATGSQTPTWASSSGAASQVTIAIKVHP
jgi:hypothetical protein